MTQNIKELAQRPQSALFAGGICETVFGLVWLVIAGTFLLSDALPDRYSLAIGLVRIFVCFLAVPLIQFLRKRFVWPRLGYAVPRPSSPWLLPIAAILVMGVSLLAILTHSSGALMIDFFCACGNLVFYAFSRLPRFIVLSVVNFATAVGVSSLHLPLETAFPLIFGLIGLTSILSGLNEMRSLLHSRPTQGFDAE